PDLARALATTRARLSHRAVLLAEDRTAARRSLIGLADGLPSAALVSGVADVAGRVVFVFPGQGAQWTGMATELLATSAVFARRVAECAAALDPLLGWSLLDAMRETPRETPRQTAGVPAADRVDADRVDVVQPVLFAMLVSL